MESNFNPAQYTNKLIMAPMVKIGTLPARILAIRYGADLVYSEEIIDWKLLKSKRIINDALNTIDFVDEAEGVVAFRTCAEEKSKVIIQIGTADADRALKVALLVQNDVAGIDINMGCPKDFSLKGGMGAALLKQPEKIKAILTNLVSNVKIPVTCKIRVLSTIEETVSLCEMIQSCGVSAIAIHGRTKDERPQHANRNHFLKALANKLTVPVIANGGSKEIESFGDLQRFKEQTGCSSVMIARAAEWNPSIFSPTGKEELQQVIKNYLKLAVEYDNPFPVTKYNIQNMLRDLQETPHGKRFLASNLMEDLCELWELDDFFKNFQKRIFVLQEKLVEDNQRTTCEETREELPEAKRTKLDSSDTDKDDTIVIPGCVFVRGHYPEVDKLPKSIVLVWYKANGLGKCPIYTTECSDKKFRSVVRIGDQYFKTNVWEKNKRHAEQGAALAFLKYMKLSI